MGGLPPLWVADQIQKASEFNCERITEIVENLIVRKINGNFHKQRSKGPVDYRKYLLRFTEYGMASRYSFPILVDPRVSTNFKRELAGVIFKNTIFPDSWNARTNRKQSYLLWFDIFANDEVKKNENLRPLTLNEGMEAVFHCKHDQVFINEIRDKVIFFEVPEGSWRLSYEEETRDFLLNFKIASDIKDDLKFVKIFAMNTKVVEKLNPYIVGN